jgi:hypothetical protein
MLQDALPDQQGGQRDLMQPAELLGAQAGVGKALRGLPPE